jgi:hypothetical protein
LAQPQMKFRSPAPDLGLRFFLPKLELNFWGKMDKVLWSSDLCDEWFSIIFLNKNAEPQKFLIKLFGFDLQ